MLKNKDNRELCQSYSVQLYIIDDSEGWQSEVSREENKVKQDYKRCHWKRG
jgi:hypothetical protein